MSSAVGSAILIKKCKRNSRSMLADSFRADAQYFFLISRFSHSRRQVAEHLPASIFDHALRHIKDGGEHTADAAVVVSNRAIREREITLFEVVVPVDREHLACEVGCLLTVRHHSVEPGSQEVPSLGEHFANAAAQRG